MNGGPCLHLLMKRPLVTGKSSSPARGRILGFLHGVMVQQELEYVFIHRA